jgi:hypothetical protein
MKSVKTKVDNMISGNVIQRFVTGKPSPLDYNGVCTIAIKEDELGNEVTMRITR